MSFALPSPPSSHDSPESTEPISPANADTALSFLEQFSVGGWSNGDLSSMFKPDCASVDPNALLLDPTYNPDALFDPPMDFNDGMTLDGAFGGHTFDFSQPLFTPAQITDLSLAPSPIDPLSPDRSFDQSSASPTPPPVEQPSGAKRKRAEETNELIDPRIRVEAPVPKLPIPRLQPALKQAPNAPAKVSVSALPPQDGATAQSGSKRTKTSHTTIERRYRNNINTCIADLKAAVPAIRVLCKDLPERPDDVVDSRGYIDGVKVPRKPSKANILGKACEFIHVLKNREHRLTRELHGVKTLLASFENGPELVATFERDWKLKFGGPERDEVEGREHEDSDDEGSDDDEARPKKKLKSTSKKPVVLNENGEKRKRGRPKKNPTPVMTNPPTPESEKASPPPPAQYLLAGFAFFSYSFFSSSGPAHHAPTHEGRVLGSSPLFTHPAPSMTHEVFRHLHILAMVALFISFALPFVPRFWSKQSAEAVARKNAALKDALERDDDSVKRALGVRAGPISVLLELGRVNVRRLKSLLRIPSAPVNELENKAWCRVGEMEIMNGDNSAFLSRIHAYLCLTSNIPRNPSVTDLSTLALLVHPYSTQASTRLWSQAREIKDKSALEDFALSVSVEQAIEVIAEASSDLRPMEAVASFVAAKKLTSAVNDLFVSTVTGEESSEQKTDAEEIKQLREVGDSVGGDVQDAVELWKEVARSLSSAPARISSPASDSDSDSEQLSASTLSSALRTPVDAEFSPSSPGSGKDAQLDSELSALDWGEEVIESNGSAIKESLAVLRSLDLFRRVFLDQPKNVDSAMHLALHRSLAAPVFDSSVAMEDARDRAVDMLSESKRRWREL